jgi:5-(carboxyamino)imidazole ribonucleotide mutase
MTEAGTKDGPWVSLVMGSNSDLQHLQSGIDLLPKLGIHFEVRVISAHRTPDALAEYAQGLVDRGVQVVIAAAGWSAALAGVVAAHTPIPVVGIPIPNSPLLGLDSILATVQMPGGVPVATMALGAAGAKNAALFSAEIIGLSQPKVRDALLEFRRAQVEAVMEKDREVMQSFSSGGLAAK